MLRLLMLGLLLCCSLSPMSAAAAANVVLLISDNQNQDDCGCYGNTSSNAQHRSSGAAGVFVSRRICHHRLVRSQSSGDLLRAANTRQRSIRTRSRDPYLLGSLPKVKTVFTIARRSMAITPRCWASNTPRIPSLIHSLSIARSVAATSRELARWPKNSFNKPAIEPFFLTIGYSDPHPTSIERPGWGIVRQDEEVPIVDYRSGRCDRAALPARSTRRFARDSPDTIKRSADWIMASV